MRFFHRNYALLQKPFEIYLSKLVKKFTRQIDKPSSRGTRASRRQQNSLQVELGGFGVRENAEGAEGGAGKEKGQNGLDDEEKRWLKRFICYKKHMSLNL